MTNVVEFNPRVWTSGKDSKISSLEKRAATVHWLIQPEPVFRIYEERLTDDDVHTMDFFKALLEIGKVTIVNEERA